MRTLLKSLLAILLIVQSSPTTSLAAPVPKILADPLVEIIFRQTPTGAKLLSRVVSNAEGVGLRILHPTRDHFRSMLQSLSKKNSGMLQEEIARRLEIIKWEYDARVAGRAPRPNSWTEKFGLETLEKSAAAHFDDFFFYEVMRELRGKPIEFLKPNTTVRPYAASREKLFRSYLSREHRAEIDESLEIIRIQLRSQDDAQLRYAKSIIKDLAYLAFKYNVGVIPNDLLPVLTRMPKDQVMAGIRMATRSPSTTEKLEKAALDLMAQAQDEMAYRIAKGPGPIQYLD